jgi:hypothetical protein
MATRFFRNEPGDIYSDGKNAVALFDGFPPICDAINMLGAADRSKLQTPEFLAWLEKNGGDASMKEQLSAAFMLSANKYKASGGDLSRVVDILGGDSVSGAVAGHDGSVQYMLAAVPIFAARLGFTRVLEDLAAGELGVSHEGVRCRE